MSYLKTVIELIFYYQKDKRGGIPYWKDPTLLGALVGLIASILASYAGINIDTDLQLKIVGVAAGLGALLSPHTGLISKEPEAVEIDKLREMAKQVQAQNRQTSQSDFPDHGGDH